MALLLQEMILVIRTWHNKAVTLINDSPQGYIPALIHQSLSPSTCDTHNGSMDGIRWYATEPLSQKEKIIDMMNK